MNIPECSRSQIILIWWWCGCVLYWSCDVNKICVLYSFSRRLWISNQLCVCLVGFREPWCGVNRILSQKLLKWIVAKSRQNYNCVWPVMLRGFPFLRTFWFSSTLGTTAIGHGCTNQSTGRVRVLDTLPDIAPTTNQITERNRRRRRKRRRREGSNQKENVM